MLLATIARIDDEDVPRLRSWLASLTDRRDELGESYRRTGTHHELFFLIRTRTAPILVLITEVDDAERAAESFLRSNLPIDVEFKSLVQEIELEQTAVELLYDSSRYVDVPSA